MPNPLLRGGQGRAAHDVLDSGTIIIVVIILAAIAWAFSPPEDRCSASYRAPVFHSVR